MCILPFNAFRNISHLKEHLANATVVTYYSLFIYFQPYICVHLPNLDLLYFPIMLWLSPQKLTFDVNDSQVKFSWCYYPIHNSSVCDRLVGNCHYDLVISPKRFNI